MLSLAILIMFSASLYHHFLLLNKKVYKHSFLLDCLAQLFAMLVFVSIVPNDRLKDVLQIAIVMCAFVMILGAIFHYYNFVSSAVCASLLGVLYVVIMLWLGHRLSYLTWFVLVVSLLLFIAGNTIPVVYEYVWPIVHIFVFSLIFLVFRDMGLLSSHPNNNMTHNIQLMWPINIPMHHM